MEKIARFEKVSFAQFYKDIQKRFPELNEEDICAAYNEIILPKRASVGSAGYDFCTPVKVFLKKGEISLIPTGIRAIIKSGFVLEIYPRSSLGIKKNVALANTVGIIDSDYAEAENEGHILIALINQGDETVILEKGERIVQGIFKAFYLAEEDEVKNLRVGGIGSSGR